METCYSELVLFEHFFLKQHKNALKQHKHALKKHRHALKQRKHVLKQHRHALKRHWHALRQNISFGHVTTQKVLLNEMLFCLQLYGN